MAKVPTPHIGAREGEIADRVIMAEDFGKTVLMPGDPLRAKFMAERFLENPVQYNAVRGMLGFTGTYKGKRVSVQGHGMGMPSIGIYSYELFNFYGVKRIIRTGSAGSINAGVKMGDVVIGMGSCTDSNYASQYGLPGTFAPIADFGLVRAAVEKAEELGVRYKVGNILASDFFYGDDADSWKQWQKMGVLAALYMNAARCGGEALCICTISDSLVTGEACSAEERQTSFTNMMDIAFGII